MTLEIIETDLLNNNLNLDILCHQINCCTTTSYGIAKSINDKYKYANRYINRNYTKIKDIPGEIYIETDLENNNNPIIVCLAGQYTPGCIGRKINLNDNYIIETTELRELWFKKCLDKLYDYLSKFDNKKIGFPYNIGCGLAGGDWNNYYNMIIELTNKLPNHKFYLCKL